MHPPLYLRTLKTSCHWQLGREDERVESRLVDDGRLLSSTKGVAFRDDLIAISQKWSLRSFVIKVIKDFEKCEIKPIYLYIKYINI